MPAEPITPSPGIGRLLCAVILLVLIAALLYAGWIGITNYSRIHV